jgi:signal transduction histidine kinase
LPEPDNAFTSYQCLGDDWLARGGLELTEFQHILQSLTLERRPVVSESDLPQDIALALFPLQYGAQLYSILMFQWPKEFQLSEVQSNLLVTISELIGIALNRLSARELLEEEVAQRTRELMSLYEIARLYVSSEDINEVAEESLKIVLNTLRAQSGLIHLVNPNGQLVNVVAHMGMDPGLLAGFEYQPDSSRWQQISQSGKPILVLNLPGRDDLPSAFARSGFQSSLASPIRTSNTTLGAVTIFYEGDPQVTEEDLNLINLIADQIGMVIDRSMLRQKAKQAAVMEERQRLARELHDSVTQSLYSLTFMADGLRGLAEQQAWEQVQQQLAFMQDISQQALKEMRLLIYELTPSSIEQQGLVKMLQQRLSYVEQHAGMKTQLKIEGEIHLPLSMQISIYRIAQEALNNIIKHAHAKHVEVLLSSRQERLLIQIKDDGTGFDLALIPSGGMGLNNMAEHVNQLGGTLKIASSLGKGAVITFELEQGSK